MGQQQRIAIERILQKREADPASTGRHGIGLCVGDCEARADSQCGELIDRISASPPIRKLLFVEALGHTRLPFAGFRPDHRARVEPATIHAHRATEAAADLERRLYNGVPRETRWDGFEIGDFPGRAATDHSVTCSLGQVRDLERYVG
jgi:hypothetical protein